MIGLHEKCARRGFGPGPLSGLRGAAVVAGVVIALGSAVLGTPVPALAQSWWPFGGNNGGQQRPTPVPEAPVYGVPGQPEAQGGYAPGGRSPMCVELEQRLVQESQRGSDSRNLVPMVENELRQAEQAYRTQKQNLDRNDCYEYFLFSKTLRKTRRCVDLANAADETRRKIDDLEIQLQQLQGSGGRSYQDEIVRELARHNCGANYQQQARREPSGPSAFWEDEESSSGGGGSFGRLPYATYRTVCVRLCDGYYFPVSFATLPNHFQRDEEVCHSKCAAPAALYYHQNPGAGMEQAVEARSNAPYTDLKSAFRYRKEFVNGCSCKMAEFKPEPGSVPPGGDAQGWVSTETPTGSTEPQQLPPAAEPPPPAQPPQGGEQLPWSTAP